MSGNDYDFWDNFVRDASLGETEDGGSMDSFLTGKALGGGQFTSMQSLTDKGRAAMALQLPVAAGARVMFAGNLGAVLTYADPPAPGSFGTVVTVRSASGEVTAHDGKVFVKWDDGEFRSIHAEHLRPAQGTKRRGAQMSRMRVASLGDLTDFLKVANDTLIHRSTKDLWSFHRDGSEYVIERLFDSSGKPLKG